MHAQVQAPITDEHGWTEQEAVPVLTVRDDATDASASCTVARFGATVTSWKTTRATQHLWMSSLSAKGCTGPIRGGVPIAFPQFANQGPLSLHGFARTQQWEELEVGVSGQEMARVKLKLEENDETLALWPHKFKLIYAVELTATRLSLRLEVHNTDSEPWEFTSCLHTYLKVSDITQCALAGLQGAEYLDKVDGSKIKTEAPESLFVPEASKDSSPHGDGVDGFVDRIYRRANAATRLLDGGAGRLIAVKHPGWPDTVVFNPWETGKKGNKGPDYDDDGYQKMLCVEPAIATTPQRLEPGATWEGSQIIEVNCTDELRHRHEPDVMRTAGPPPGACA